MDLNELVLLQTLFKENIVTDSYLMLCLFSNREELYFLELIKSLASLVNIGGVHLSAADVDHILCIICGIY